MPEGSSWVSCPCLSLHLFSTSFRKVQSPDTNIFWIVYSKGGRGKTGSTASTSLDKLGLTKDQSSKFQKLANHKEIVERVKAEAMNKIASSNNHTCIHLN